MTSRSLTRGMVAAACLVGLGGCMRMQPKTVTAMSPPTTLIAGDGSVCSVSEKYYAKMVVGMKAVCEWRGGSIKGFGE